MAQIILPNVATRQPPIGDARINWSNPLTKGMAACFLGNTGMELVHGIQFLKDGTPTTTLNQSGSCMHLVNSGASYDGWYAPEQTSGSRSDNLYDPTAPPITLVIVGNGKSGTNVGAGIGRGNGSSTSAFLLSFWDGSFKGATCAVTTSGGNISTPPPSTATSTVTGMHVACASVGANNTIVYCDKFQRDSNSTPSGNFTYQYSDQYRCLNAGSGFMFGGGDIALAFLIRGIAWTDSQYYAFYSNPWQIFEGVPNKYWVNTSAVTGVIFDAASTSGYQAVQSTYSWSHTVTTQSNRVLVVALSLFATGSGSSITYNGASLTNDASSTVTNGVYRTEIWYLIAPATGTNTIAVTLSGAITSVANASSYYNADQTAPIEARGQNTGTGNPATVSVTTINTGSVVVSNLTTVTSSGVTSAAGENQRENTAGVLGSSVLADKGPISVPASTTLTFNGIGTLDVWAISGISIKVPGDANPSVTGVSSTCSTGTVSVEVDYGLSGVSSSVNTGTVFDEIDFVPSGVSSTVSAGSVSTVAGGSGSASGVQSSISVGSLGITVSNAIIGVLSTIQVAQLFQNLAKVYDWIVSARRRGKR